MITTIDYYSVACLSAHCREQHLRKYLWEPSHPILQSCPLLAWVS